MFAAFNTNVCFGKLIVFLINLRLYDKAPHVPVNLVVHGPAAKLMLCVTFTAISW